MSIDPKLIRSAFIGGKIKNIIEERGMTITSIVEKMWVSHPSIINSLNWKVSWSDKLFTRICNAIWLSEREINEIFKEADKEAYKFKYWEDLNLLEDIDFDVALRKEYWQELDDETIWKIKSFIDHVKFLNENEK